MLPVLGPELQALIEGTRGNVSARTTAVDLTLPLHLLSNFGQHLCGHVCINKVSLT